jgi:hypothetical protein
MSYEQPEPDELVREALAETMSGISEECWCAKWMRGNEFALWKAITTDNGKNGACDIPVCDLNRLRHLHKLAGGWWIWPEGEDKMRFVTTKEWLAIIAQHPVD